MRTELQGQIIEIVKERLCNKPWYKGVCLDSVPTDEKIIDLGINYWVRTLINDTIYWDEK